ncbi:MAG: MoaD/ThiS family protein [Methanococcoides sp.]|nr:MoaD/ThiS family protein [Methanococcoides sp.]MCD4806723.1 MoaD/ThiS family protein [Methanococcoides sp.]MCD4822159.1 MoaD/ThiS family protein [Methanococcoides sp.]
MSTTIKVKIFPDNPDGQIINVPDDSTYEDLLNIMDINQELVILLNDGKAVPIDDIVVEGTVTILKAISGG